MSHWEPSIIVDNPWIAFPFVFRQGGIMAKDYAMEHKAGFLQITLRK